jgi:hypothetical protein
MSRSEDLTRRALMYAGWYDGTVTEIDGKWYGAGVLD